ncbi:MAG: MerR family transcriptional regulator [Prevotella sp.]|nr:MerR family transcriptional regulator [Candidatus Prevotella equi]
MSLITNKELKTYYTIKEVAEMFSLTESTLRYWETEFPHLRPRTTTNKVRQYAEKDIEELKLIYNLIKVRGFKISAARKMLHANRDGVEQSQKVIEKLQDVKEQLLDLKASIDKII